MTSAELGAALAAAVRTAFAGSGFAIHDDTPNNTALPAVWPEYSSGYIGADRVSSGVMVLRVVAAVAPHVAPAQTAVIYDAIDRCHTITAAALGNSAIGSREHFLGPVQIGGVDHTALLYSLTIGVALPC